VVAAAVGGILGAWARALKGAALAIAFVPAMLLAQPRLPPVDQAASAPDFFAFRARLQTALAQRDQQAVIAALHKDVKLSFGGDVGVDDFKRMWTPQAPDSRLWQTLAAVLALGGTFAVDGSFTAPYVFTKWPQKFDAFNHMAAIGSGIRVRAAPGATAAVIGALDFTIVELAGTSSPDAADTGWIKVKLPAGRVGFVDERYLRSPIDYRVNFAKIDGRWQITFFLAGD
jgi:hypothetical protein